jgi:hypothetical protein
VEGPVAKGAVGVVVAGDGRGWSGGGWGMVGWHASMIDTANVAPVDRPHVSMETAAASLPTARGNSSSAPLPLAVAAATAAATDAVDCGCTSAAREGMRIAARGVGGAGEGRGGASPW